jgi:alpha-L-fucosidase
MKKLLLLFIIIFASAAHAQQPESKADRDKRMGWWRDDTFGMFIHWGAYSVLAGEYKGQEVKDIGEWIMERFKIPIPEYEQYVKQFNPQQFNAKEWVRVAKGAGVKYIVITSKHHDGFCLWDSKVSEYDIMDFAPYKKDILKELSVACKEAGIKFCLYYSIMDWHHPDANAKQFQPRPTLNPDWGSYRENYLKPQLAELIKNYDPAVLWFDGEWVAEWTEPQGKQLYAFLRGLKPDLIINNRVGKGRKGMNGMNAYEDAAGDFGTPEQEIIEGTSEYDWESCMTMNDTWGFKKNDHNWKSATTLIHNLIDIAAKGGNYLLNIGPKADGTIPPESVERLAEMGKWLKINGEAIYTTNSLKKYKQGDSLRFTAGKDGKVIYAIVLKRAGQININNMTATKSTTITMLGIEKPLTWKQEKDGSILVNLPPKLPCEHAWTLKIKN